MKKRLSLYILLLIILPAIQAMDNNQRPHKKRGLEEYSGKEYSAPKRVRAMNISLSHQEQTKLDRKLMQECKKNLESEKGKQKQLETVKELLQKGANPLTLYQQGSEIYTSVSLALQHKKLVITKILLDHIKNNDLNLFEPHVRDAVIDITIQNDWPHILQQIIKLPHFDTMGISTFLNYVFLIRNDIPSAACIDVIKSNFNLTRYLNTRQNDSQIIPMHTSLEGTNSSIQKLILFLNAGGDPNIKNSQGKTPLQTLLSTNLIRMDEEKTTKQLELLLKHDSNPNNKDNEGKTALHFLLTIPPCNNPDAFDQQLYKNNRTRYLTSIPLIQERLKKLHLLVQYGANKNIYEDQEAYTPIEQAIIDGDYGVLASEIFGYPLSATQQKRAQELWSEIKKMYLSRLPKEVAQEIYIKALEYENLVSPTIFCQKLLHGNDPAIKIMQKRSHRLITICKELGLQEKAKDLRIQLDTFIEQYTQQQCPCQRMNTIIALYKNKNTYAIWFYLILGSIEYAKQSIKQTVNNCQCKIAHKKRYNQHMQYELAQKMNALNVAMQHYK